MTLPESIILHIFSFCPSFVFYNHCKTILKYNTTSSINLVGKYCFQNESMPEKYLFLDYFLFHKHLLILDNYNNFEEYLQENCWGRNLCNKNPNNKIIHNSLRNIMRLSYFVICLRQLAREQRHKTENKIEQTNIGISFQCLIESINKESESQTKMLKYYMTCNIENKTP